MKKFLFFAVVAALFSACAQDVVVETLPAVVDDAPSAITLDLESEDTRIQLNEAQKTVWTNGDKVSVFYRSDANQKWAYNGPTGSRTAEIYRVDSGQSTQKLPKVVVVYPYNENYYINPETCGIQAFMPAEQTYMKDSYGLDGNIMISSSEYNQFSLKSVCGWLKLQLTGNGEKITNISVTTEKGKISGPFTVDCSNGTLTPSAEATNTVTVTFGEGLALSAEATPIYVAVPAGSHGLYNIVITSTEGETMIVKYNSDDKPVKVENEDDDSDELFNFDEDDQLGECQGERNLHQGDPQQDEEWYSAHHTYLYIAITLQLHQHQPIVQLHRTLVLQEG